MSIGLRLRELRKEKGKTLKDVGSELNISWSGLAEIERDERNCNSSTLSLLANYYGVSTDYILCKTDNKNSKIGNIDNIDIAFYEQHGIVTEEQMKEISKFIDFIKSRDKK